MRPNPAAGTGWRSSPAPERRCRSSAAASGPDRARKLDQAAFEKIIDPVAEPARQRPAESRETVRGAGKHLELALVAGGDPPGVHEQGVVDQQVLGAHGE